VWVGVGVVDSKDGADGENHGSRGDGDCGEDEGDGEHERSESDLYGGVD
jgi:hypothetical protein